MKKVLRVGTKSLIHKLRQCVQDEPIMLFSGLYSALKRFVIIQFNEMADDRAVARSKKELFDPFGDEK